MSIRAIGESIWNVIPTNPLSGKYSLNLPRIANNLNKIAIPAIAIIALSNITVAEAGPLAFAACVAGCEMACTQAALIGAIPSGGWSLLAVVGSALFCPTVCGPALVAPTP